MIAAKMIRGAQTCAAFSVFRAYDEDTARRRAPRGGNICAGAPFAGIFCDSALLGRNNAANGFLQIDKALRE